MKKLFLILVLLAGISFAKENNNALGVFVASNNVFFPIENYGGGIDFKHFDANSIWNIYLNNLYIGEKTTFGVEGGYYFLLPNLIKADASAGKFPLYLGPDLGVGIWSGGKAPSRYKGFAVAIKAVGGISWFTPTSFKMDVSFEILSPDIGLKSESHELSTAKWEDDVGFGFINGLFGLGLRLLFHMYLF